MSQHIKVFCSVHDHCSNYTPDGSMMCIFSHFVNTYIDLGTSPPSIHKKCHIFKVLVGPLSRG